MDADLGDAVAGGLREQGEEVVDVAVDVAVGQQADEVEWLAGVLDGGDGVVPSRAGEQGFAGDRNLHELGALVEDPPGTQGVVSDFAVAHVAVGRHPDRSAVGQQAGERRQAAQRVERGCMCKRNSVADVAAADADAVHDDSDDRAYRGFSGGVRAQ